MGYGNEHASMLTLSLEMISGKKKNIFLSYLVYRQVSNVHYTLALSLYNSWKVFTLLIWLDSNSNDNKN